MTGPGPFLPLAIWALGAIGCAIVIARNFGGYARSTRPPAEPPSSAAPDGTER